ncbi:MAG: hypothetical protein ACREX8_08770 [Gammaproteobacteria bacterium]
MPDPTGNGHRNDWPVCCRDAIGRRRHMIVLADRVGIVVIAPPGETAVLSPTEVTVLHRALDHAVVQHQQLRGHDQ